MGQGDGVTGGRKGQWMLSQHRNMLTDWIIINKQKIYNVTDLIVIGGAKERRALH